MYFDFIVMALMGVGAAAGLFDWFDSDTPEDPEPEDEPIADVPGDDPSDDPGDEPGDETGDDTGDDPADVPTDDGDSAPATETTVLIEDADGNVTETTVDTSASDGTVTLTGTPDSDIITADPDAGQEFGISSGAGDDTINFGLGVSADGGDGADMLNLTVTETAFAANTAAGAAALSTSADLSGTSDALAVEIDDSIEGFVHFVTVTTTGPDDPSEDGETVSRFVSQTLYILVTDSAEAPDQETVLGNPDGTQIVQVDLGTQLETYDVADQTTPTSVQGAINTDPQIAINRDIATETTLGV